MIAAIGTSGITHLRSVARLTCAAYSTGESFAYAYDAASNVIAMTETITATTVTTYTYNAANQLVTARASDDGVTWYYTFDQRGNLTRQTPGGTAPSEGETRYTYNGAGRLVRAGGLSLVGLKCTGSVHPK